MAYNTYIIAILCCAASTQLSIYTYNLHKYYIPPYRISSTHSISLFIFIFCVSTGALFGALFGGLFLQYGRRRILTVMSLPFSLSWIITVFAKSVTTMYATAFLGGFCCSIISMVTQVRIFRINKYWMNSCLFWWKCGSEIFHPIMQFRWKWFCKKWIHDFWFIDFVVLLLFLSARCTSVRLLRPMCVVFCRPFRKLPAIWAYWYRIHWAHIWIGVNWPCSYRLRPCYFSWLWFIYPKRQAF